MSSTPAPPGRTPGLPSPEIPILSWQPAQFLSAWLISFIGISGFELKSKNTSPPSGNHFCCRQDSLTAGRRSFSQAPGGAQYSSQPEPFFRGSRVWPLDPPMKHEKGETVIITGSAGPTGNFSKYNRRGGCFTENGKFFKTAAETLPGCGRSGPAAASGPGAWPPSGLPCGHRRTGVVSLCHR